MTTTYAPSDILADLSPLALRLATLRAWVVQGETEVKAKPPSRAEGFCSSISASAADPIQMKAALDAWLDGQEEDEISCDTIRRASSRTEYERDHPYWTSPLALASAEAIEREAMAGDAKNKPKELFRGLSNIDESDVLEWIKSGEVPDRSRLSSFTEKLEVARSFYSSTYENDAEGEVSVVLRTRGYGLSVNDYYEERGWESRSYSEREHILYKPGAWRIRKHRVVDLGTGSLVYLIDIEQSVGVG